MCCNRDTEEQLRHQARADFHDLIHHHSRSLQGLLATTADALRGKCLKFFKISNRSGELQKLSRSQTAWKGGGEGETESSSFLTRVLETTRIERETVVSSELAKPNRDYYYFYVPTGTLFLPSTPLPTHSPSSSPLLIPLLLSSCFTTINHRR